MAVVQLSTDPFSRWTQIRESIKARGFSCDWCGCKPKTLYRYGSERDNANGGTRSWAVGIFCNKECHDAYHNI